MQWNVSSKDSEMEVQSLFLNYSGALKSAERDSIALVRIHQFHVVDFDVWEITKEQKKLGHWFMTF